MSASLTAVRPRRASRLVAPPPEVSERRVRRRLYFAYGMLVFNTMTFYPGVSFIHIPSAIGKGVSQAALPVALLVIISLNRRGVIRPNVFLCLVSLLVLGAFFATMQPEHFGTIYRTFRLAGYVAALWLLTPWWGRRDMLLVRCHLTAYSVLLGSAVLGLLVAPGRARSGGRLGGVVWPIPPTQLAHYAAVVIGVTVILWFCGHMRGKTTGFVVAISGAILILTHTRTALVGLLAAILVAGLSLIVAKARVRRLFAIAGAVAGVAIITLSGVITTWLARGEGTTELTNLTGRTKVWGPLLSFPRNKYQEIFGFGLSNSSFNGLPIDSNWLASYQEQGLFGVVVCATILLFLLVAAYFQPRGVQRALALFFVTYCLIASFTEVGFTDVSPYLLEVTLAASLLVPPIEGRIPI
jgi:hypothetical protein